MEAACRVELTAAVEAAAVVEAAKVAVAVTAAEAVAAVAAVAVEVMREEAESATWEGIERCVRHRRMGMNCHVRRFAKNRWSSCLLVLLPL